MKIFTLIVCASQIPLLHAATTFYQTGGPVLVNAQTDDDIIIGDAPGGPATQVFFEAGASVDGLGVFDQSVGVGGNSQAVFNAGAVSGNANSFQNALLDINGGTFSSDVSSFSTSTIDYSGGRVLGDLVVSEGSQGTVSGGRVDGNLVALDDASLNVVGGTVGSVVFLEDFSYSTIGGGVFESDIVTFNRAHVEISDLDTVNDVFLRDDSTGSISGGFFPGIVGLRDNASLEVTGGTFRGQFQIDTELTLRGGDLVLDPGGFGLATAGGQITVVGTGFTLDGNPVPFGDLLALGGRLEGVLEDGSPLDVLVDRDPFSDPAFFGNITLIPEPSLGILVVLGCGLALGCRRRIS